MRSTYQQRSDRYAGEISNYKKKLRLISVLRLLCFVGALVLPFKVYQIHTSLAIGVFVLMLVSFMSLILLYARVERHRNLLFNLWIVNLNEQKALDGDLSPFKRGSKYTDHSHPYSLDLDIFGEFSIFRFLNRTVSRSGEKRLAGWLKDPLLNTQKLQNRQEAVCELASNLEWRQQFAAEGMLHDEEAFELALLKKVSSEEVNFGKENIYRIAAYIIPAISITHVGVVIAGQMTISSLFLTVGLQWMLAYVKRKEVSHFFNLFGKQSALLQKYSALLKLIEKEKFHSPLLQQLNKKLRGEHSAGELIKVLSKEVWRFESRLNMVVGVFLNSFLLWDIRCCLALSKWHRNHRHQVMEWLDVVAEMDALSSLANYTRNHPESNFPEPLHGEPLLDAEALGHPLIDSEERVDNDFFVSGRANFGIVTGANMAGKSTFLRAVGVNLVMAMAGAPVCARKFRFTPMGLVTHMRTTDDLAKHESYFQAELKRLKNILDTLRREGQLFIILDEILRGTNSEDKLKGSRKYLEQLIKYEGTGLVATHDLKLTEMEREYPLKIQNLCFEIELTGEFLKFDYKLSKGVTQTMNATYLMAQMGLISPD